MKIATVGTHSTGKTTYIEDFLKNWSMYETDKNSYRDLIKTNKIKHSKEGTEDSQREILNFLVDQTIESSKKDFVILDRCVLDNLAYSSWLNLNEKVSDKFLEETRIIVKETLKMFDVIFFFPLTKVAEVPLEDNELRDIDPIYREEIDTIFKAFQQSYLRGDGRVFPNDDCPALIEIFGSREQRIKMTELYITKDGKPFGDDQSLISDIIPATFKL
jgi:GTPase SAR1 family protein